MNHVEALRESINQTARVSRANQLFLLIIGTYIALLIANTDDTLLLKGDLIELPLMQVGIPVVLFYAVAPCLYVLFNCILFLRLYRLSSIAKLLRSRIAHHTHADHRVETHLLFPFDFLQVMVNSPGARGSLYLTLGIVIISLGLLPLLLLLWLQTRFLPYQDEGITLIHQLSITAYIAALILFSIAIIRTTSKESSAHWWPRRALDPKSLSLLAIAVASLFALIFTWCIALVPESRMERNIGITAAIEILFEDWWRTETRLGTATPYFRRHLHVVGREVALHELPNEVKAAVVQGANEENAWKQMEELDLSGRELKYARFDFAQFRRVVLDNATLDGASFGNAELIGVSLVGASLKDTIMSNSAIHSTNFSKGLLHGMDLSDSEMHDAVFTGAELHGLNLSGAKLNGGDFNGAELHGAELRDAQFYGTDLGQAELWGASMLNTTMYGVNLQAAEMYGINTAMVGGALSIFLTFVLPSMSMNIVNLEQVKVAGAEVFGVSGNYIYGMGVDSVKPDDWEEVAQGIKTGLERRAGGIKLTEEKIDGRMNRIAKQVDESDPLVGFSPIASYKACFWHNNTGWFSSREPTGEDCDRELVEYVCHRSTARTTKGLVNIYRDSNSDVAALHALLVLKKGMNECPSLTREVTTEICVIHNVQHRTYRFEEANVAGDRKIAEEIGVLREEIKSLCNESGSST